MKFTPTIPNFLTLFRVVLIIPMLYYIWKGGVVSLAIALIIFGISALTDTFDGILARKLNQMSEFGAYFDPLADKILVIALYAVFALKPELFIPWWMVLIIVLRDISITQLRNYAKKHDLKFTTSFAAKAKTTVQMVVGFIVMLYLLILEAAAKHVSLPVEPAQSVWAALIPGFSWLVWVPLGLTSAVVLFTIYTAVDYFKTVLIKRG